MAESVQGTRRRVRDSVESALPRGQALSNEVWHQRHRVIVALVFGHAIGLLIFGVLRGFDPIHVLSEVGAIAACGLLARSSRLPRRSRSVAATFGLLLASGVLVHLSGGVIETHFHFFVMVAVVSLYQDWTPFLLAIGFVVLHHGTIGVLDAESVYNHGPAQRDPWGWAAIHGLFIAGESVVLLVGWRFIEDAAKARSEMARKLSISERRFRNAFHNALSGMILAGADNEIVEVNPAFSTMLGYSSDHVRKLSMQTLIHPDDRDRTLRALCDVRTGRDPMAQIECRFISVDGNSVWADVSFSRAHEAEDDAAYVVVQAHDITQRKKAEADKDVLESQLRQSQKMEAVGHLAGGVAHDFNNLLAVIGNYADFIATDLDPASEMSADVREIRAAADRGAQLTRQLLTFSRKEVVRPEVVDVGHALVELQRILARTIGEHIELKIVTPDESATTLIDRGELEQVVMNLAVNARDAMPNGGVLTIGAHVLELDSAYVELHPGAHPGDYVCLAVSDSGTGIAPEVQARIFEPFFTTKERGSGTGLGLATVYGIATRANGHVRVYSEPDIGTTFRVYLPRTDAPVAKEASEMRRPSTVGGECILVVEDEPGLLRVAARILRNHGYAVLEASSGDEALSLLQHDRARVDLLLTDVVMPGMSGRQLSHATGLPTLYMSGYTDDIVAQQGVLTSGELLVQKPFTAADLLTKVREALAVYQKVRTDDGSGLPTRILVIDDDTRISEVVKLVLAADDFKNVWLADDGQNAIEIAERIRPTIAVLDYSMPNTDGEAVAARLREVVPDIKIVSFSAVLDEMPQWADDFVRKVEIAELPTALRRLAPVA